MSVINEILQKLEETLRRGYTPKILIVSPKVLAELLQEPTFSDVSTYGPYEPLMTGEVGKIFGCKIIVSNNIPQITDDLMEENDNPSSRIRLKMKEIVVISDEYVGLN